ncbi:metal-dependent transcriptional regulator [Halorubrum sp. CBA1125]|uniref:metal-dependent transcriptional regulator n=1 Tax=Halorubrum sp. CBA1125 TaxID=2668072 RepID=UPI0012E6F7F0|nr:metal-dependent transcriptional regulator [Halorubrum sp. CBA1125]MUW13512.1 metal-dependent transcriptional regulator [Halorubrum sp. CBA1125]
MAIDHSQADVCGCTRPTVCVDRHRGLYLVTIGRVGIDRDDRVRTGEVSDRLDVAPSSVTEMFERLAAAGLLRYEKQAGVVLTNRGREIALELETRQCAVRTFFRRRTGFDMSLEVGYRIGYALPDEAIERLQVLVDEMSNPCSATPPTGIEQCPFTETGC